MTAAFFLHQPDHKFIHRWVFQNKDSLALHSAEKKSKVPPARCQAAAHARDNLAWAEGHDSDLGFHRQDMRGMTTDVQNLG